MISSSRPDAVLLVIIVAVVGALLFPGYACAEMVSFNAVVGDETRMANTQQVEHDNIPYVSLSSVVRQFKGECSIRSSRVQVDFNRGSAWLHVNGALVSSTHGEFVVGHPILQVDEEALMAVGDVAPFFEKAFRVSVNQVAPGVRSLVPEGQDIATQLPQADPGTLSDTSVSAASPVLDTAIHVIVIDPGHGGPDEGVVGSEDVREKDVALAIALELRRVLEEVHEKKAVLTRDRDVQLPVGLDLSQFAAKHNADLFVSIHVGASHSEAAHGFELFCPNEAAVLRAVGGGLDWGATPITATQGLMERNRAFAESVGARMAEATSAPNRGIRHVGCRVLEGLRTAGFLIEVGCMTNPREAALLASESYQSRVAGAIAAGIADMPENADP